MKNGDLPAFARPGYEQTNLADNVRYEHTDGLTKREYFAVKLLASLAPRYGQYANQQGTGIQMMVADAIDIADELLKQLEK